MISKTGNSAHDATVLSSKSTRQTAVAVATTQAQIVTAQTVFYRACLASKSRTRLTPATRLSR